MTQQQLFSQKSDQLEVSSLPPAKRSEVVAVGVPSNGEIEGVSAESIFACVDCDEEFYYSEPFYCDNCGCTEFEREEGSN